MSIKFKWHNSHPKMSGSIPAPEPVERGRAVRREPGPPPWQPRPFGFPVFQPRLRMDPVSGARRTLTGLARRVQLPGGAAAALGGAVRRGEGPLVGRDSLRPFLPAVRSRRIVRDDASSMDALVSRAPRYSVATGASRMVSRSNRAMSSASCVRWLLISGISPLERLRR